MDSFSVLNLNIMHGRNLKSAVFPPFVSRQKIQKNIEKIVDTIRQYGPDVVTLQEVDECSVFSGSFDQFDFIKIRLDYPFAYFAPSCQGRFLNSKIFVTGNAIFSRYPLERCASHRFDFSFPTDRMGFIVTDMILPDGKTITITSIHLVYLDWLHSNSRTRQLKVVENAVLARKNGIIISGDFNCGLVGKEDSLRDFVRRLDLCTFQPEARDLFTYPAWSPNQRIDWIFGSRDIKLISFEKLRGDLSDHLGILAQFSI